MKCDDMFCRDGTSVRMTTNGIVKVQGIFISRLVENGLAESTGLLAVNDEVTIIFFTNYFLHPYNFSVDEKYFSLRFVYNVFFLLLFANFDESQFFKKFRCRSVAVIKNSIRTIEIKLFCNLQV